MIPILIPPIPHLEVTRNRPMHLLLAHLMDDQQYVRFYQRERAGNSYLILDNGAHENRRGEHMQDLLDKAGRVQAQEVVLPDVLENASGTVEATVNALRWIETREGMRAVRSAWYPNLMIVPQGVDAQAFEQCLDALLNAYGAFLARSEGEYTPRLTIGVSKDYEHWFADGVYGVVKTIVIPRADEYATRIHLLGWGRDLWVYRKIVKEFGHRIRSVDSAKPFVYAGHGIALDPHKPAPPYPKRTPTYFTDELDIHAPCMFKNIRVFDEMVGGQE